VEATRALGAELTEAVGGVVDAAAAADSLFTGRREAYAKLESDCLGSLAASAAAAGATPDDAGRGFRSSTSQLNLSRFCH
jgi:hypothetical protein